ncbi:uncharacterized protein EV420DRAFT_1644932 [Desarmillaria tabescens]|uniref:DUF6535 domain-containing protein n=1 Tax=Armillaria tabescens TaxID=1929756 RepID=A0AA39KAN4_ARMTA|nr:uncharacterized protein EV420DRAFT_1644932 [Desarmillaria tabescens]KAK0455293.1 hypothetical protein EV420DRAFT_1644932 [Desarmillaria tabescens]
MTSCDRIILLSVPSFFDPLSVRLCLDNYWRRILRETTWHEFFLIGDLDGKRATMDIRDIHAERHPSCKTMQDKTLLGAKNSTTLYVGQCLDLAHICRRAADFGVEMLAGARDSIDIMIYFVDIFSTVLTTFVVQTSQNMQPDYNQVSALLLFEVSKATASNG